MPVTRSVSALARENARIARDFNNRNTTLSFGADGGIQGEQYEFGRGSNYATVSLLLNWTFFDGGARLDNRVELTHHVLRLREDLTR